MAKAHRTNIIRSTGRIFKKGGKRIGRSIKSSAKRGGKKLKALSYRHF